jgi:hypothetical protein
MLRSTNCDNVPGGLEADPRVLDSLEESAREGSPFLLAADV